MNMKKIAIYITEFINAVLCGIGIHDWIYIPLGRMLCPRCGAVRDI